MKKLIFLSVAMLGLFSGVQLFGLRNIVVNIEPGEKKLRQITIITTNPACKRPVDDRSLTYGIYVFKTKCVLKDCVKKVIVTEPYTNKEIDSLTIQSKRKPCQDVYIRINAQGKIESVNELLKEDLTAIHKALPQHAQRALAPFVHKDFSLDSDFVDYLKALKDYRQRILTEAKQPFYDIPSVSFDL